MLKPPTKYGYQTWRYRYRLCHGYDICDYPYPCGYRYAYPHRFSVPMPMPMTKVLSACITEDLLAQMELHQMLPMMHFGG